MAIWLCVVNFHLLGDLTAFYECVQMNIRMGTQLRKSTTTAAKQANKTEWKMDLSCVNIGYVPLLGSAK